MALLDFKQYLYKVQQQYIEMKADLSDFEEALKAGYITEDKLQEVKNDVLELETNYHRLLYAAFLLEIPRKKSNKSKFKKQNKDLTTYFEAVSADEASVISENTSLLTHLRQELKNLKGQQ